MSGFGEQLVTIASLIVGVAIVAVLVSRNSNTANVISAGGNAFASALGTAISPVTTGFTGGASTQPLNYNYGPMNSFQYY